MIKDAVGLYVVACKDVHNIFLKEKKDGVEQYTQYDHIFVLKKPTLYCIWLYIYICITNLELYISNINT